MKIVGVGQMFNLQTGEMEDMVQIIAPDGSQFSIPTTNDGARILVTKALDGRFEEPEEPAAEDVDFSEDVYDDDGIATFGGDVDEPEEPEEEPRVVARPKSPGLGRKMNNPDRSGVPSYGISRVDDRGNPILPEAPQGISFEDDDEEDDPGESI